LRTASAFSHQHLRAGDGFLLRVVLQQLAGDVAAQRDAQAHDEQIDQVEFGEQFHGDLLEGGHVSAGACQRVFVLARRFTG